MAHYQQMNAPRKGAAPARLATDGDCTVPSRNTILNPEGKETVVITNAALIKIAYAHRIDPLAKELGTKRDAKIDMRLVKAAIFTELRSEQFVNIGIRLKALAMDMRTDIDIGICKKLLRLMA